MLFDSSSFSCPPFLQAAAIVDHLCQTTQSSSQQKKARPPESVEKAKEDESVKKNVKEEGEKMKVDHQQDEAEEIKMEQDVAEKDESADSQSAAVSFLNMAKQLICGYL
jgi:hypothetical protein